ncbi:RNase A-like domain-containing protein [Paraburkholderia sp. 40]|uniref:RNase A-like domain-containing protein n=1 Tax=unclassified Paraburkholderia TaxID=2615204 RepID=UPI003D230523
MSQVNESDGVRVVLSAPQLAAVLARQSISMTEMLSNRLWGGLQVVGGVLEMVGAGALCVLPDPTMASKAGCIVFGVHGSDTAATGLRQLWTGQDTATLTQRGTAKLAEAMKASPDMANNIGLSLDIAVSVGVAGSIKAVRASAITMGRINLMMHEAKAGSGIGGHTLRKHVGRTEAQLSERLLKEPWRDRVSSFANIPAAEWAISEAMQANANAIKSWAASPGRELVLKKDVGKNVGYTLLKESRRLINSSKVTVILRNQAYNGMPYYILTAYLDA